MKILAFETSCDETSVAVVEDGKKILSNIISTQIDIHKEFGGVVPHGITLRIFYQYLLKLWKKQIVN